MTFTFTSGPLTAFELAWLHHYYAEVSRGLVHTADWHTKMAAVQARFDEHGSETTGVYDRDGVLSDDIL